MVPRPARGGCYRVWAVLDVWGRISKGSGVPVVDLLRATLHQGVGVRGAR